MHKIKHMLEGHSMIKFSSFMNLSFCLWAFLILLFIAIFNCRGGLICACIMFDLQLLCITTFFKTSITLRFFIFSCFLLQWLVNLCVSCIMFDL